MNLSDECENKLKIWVGAETWSSNHDLDMNRFYHFVNAYKIYHGCHISDESILSETIAGYAKVATNSELFEIIKERVSLMCDILDFIKITSE